MSKRLSAQEEKFAYLCLSETLSNAYRQAYNIDKASTKSVNELASRKAKTQRIASRIAELKERQLVKLEDADVATAKERRAVLTAIIRDSQARHRDIVSAVHLLSQLEGEFSTAQSETTINVLGGALASRTNVLIPGRSIGYRECERVGMESVRA
jgi:hypothetical protein